MARYDLESAGLKPLRRRKTSKASDVCQMTLGEILQKVKGKERMMSLPHFLIDIDLPA